MKRKTFNLKGFYSGMHITIQKHLFKENGNGLCLFCKKDIYTEEPCRPRKILYPPFYHFINNSGFKFDSKKKKWRKDWEDIGYSLSQLYNFFIKSNQQ